MTSDGSGYSLNNKTPNQNDVVSLQLTAIKGEMYMAIEKEGYSNETIVHDGDMNVELRVVDSNRIRKKYNKTITHFVKPKSDAPGGFVCCGSKGPTLTFKVCKLADKTETRKFIKDPVFRRASQIMRDAAKEDEVSEASILDSPSRAGSLVAAGPLATEPAAEKEVSPEDPASPTSDVSSPASAGVSVPTPEPAETEPAPLEAAAEVIVENLVS
ncbi:hypothetical protein ATCC90586_012020 [Pythium insidiosum]|nr:hypothetical protein ATCC90586_012020 [Pythium insidiosum]